MKLWQCRNYEIKSIMTLTFFIIMTYLIISTIEFESLLWKPISTTFLKSQNYDTKCYNYEIMSNYEIKIVTMLKWWDEVDFAQKNGDLVSFWEFWQKKWIRKSLKVSLTKRSTTALTSIVIFYILPMYKHTLVFIPSQQLSYSSFSYNAFKSSVRTTNLI